MQSIKPILSLIILCCSLSGFAQEIPVPNGYIMFDTVSGDLDRDGISDW